MGLMIVFMVMITGIVGATAMTAILFTLFSRLRALESGSRSDENLRLEAEVARLREELETAASELVRLTERVDFTEKLLSDGSRDE